MFHVSSARICFLLDEVLAVTFQYPQRANSSYLKASDTILVLRCETQAQLGLGLAAEFCDRLAEGSGSCLWVWVSLSGFSGSIPEEGPTSPTPRIFHNINDVRGVFWSQERLQNSTARKGIVSHRPRDDFRFCGRCEHLALLQSSVPTGMERLLVCIKPPFTEKLNVDMAG